MIEQFKQLTDELVKATEERDILEVDYELEKARMMFSAEVENLKNQGQRDAQITLLMHENGWDRNIARARTDYRIAYYKWASLKSIIDSNKFKD